MGRRATAMIALVVVLGISVSGCGDDTEDALADFFSIGHDEGDTSDHLLAVGGNTPQDPQGRYYLHHGDQGSDVEVLQARMVELGAPISVDGVFGDETLLAVLVFQTSEGLTADGVVGSQTWAALDEPINEPDWDLAELPTEYATDEPGPATTGGDTPTDTAASGDGGNVGSHGAPDGDAGTWSRAVISLSTQTATFYDADGNVAMQAPVSTGRNGLTPAGAFHVQSKSELAYAGNGVTMKHMTRFNGGIGFHAIPERADGTDLETPLGQRPVSHGCIRMNDEVALQVFENLPIGAPVEVVA